MSEKEFTETDPELQKWEILKNRYQDVKKKFEQKFQTIRSGHLGDMGNIFTPVNLALAMHKNDESAPPFVSFNELNHRLDVALIYLHLLDTYPDFARGENTEEGYFTNLELDPNHYQVDYVLKAQKLLEQANKPK